MAADAGDFDFPTLLAELGGRTLLSVPRTHPARSPKPVRAPRANAPEHAARHEVLPPNPPARVLASWIAVAEECAERRCRDLAGDLASTTARSVTALGPGGDRTLLLDALTAVAERRARKADGPAAATALDAIGLVYDLSCPVPLGGGCGEPRFWEMLAFERARGGPRRRSGEGDRRL